MGPIFNKLSEDHIEFPSILFPSSSHTHHIRYFLVLLARMITHINITLIISSHIDLCWNDNHRWATGDALLILRGGILCGTQHGEQQRRRRGGR